ncbi:MAG: hypothetical protein CME62_03845 [Halobacteriovoraceae bacterium]|nr:hypothetical protein [Halobacteriovoraceae bacterium]|tara:strand:+ start:21592 stop:22719 length:1128 start_codon:yes stop_codon:yes gene_type:complete
MKLLITTLILTQFALAGKMPALEKMNKDFNYSDDLDFKNMELAIERHEKSFLSKDLNETLRFGKKTIKRQKLYDTLLAFKALMLETKECFKTVAKDECYKTFNEKMNRSFDAYRPMPLSWEKGYSEKKTHFTAYYSPDFEGSKTQTDVYKYPIYGIPKSAKLRSKTSDQINFGGALKGKGLELFYVKESLYDIWLLHVQGGGRVKVKNKDGSYKKYYLSYAGSNKQKFKFLYHYMKDQGMITNGSVPDQRAYFEAHPEDQRRILASCPSFIFFKVTTTEPLGTENVPLTEKRSIATDYRRVHEYGILNFIRTQKPVVRGGHRQMQDFSRFFINQDTGGAIKGNARVDMYFGYGKDAERAAYGVNNLGEQYYLLLK